MTSFIPHDEELFPVHELTDAIFEESIRENIQEVAAQQLPTDVDRLQDWLHRSEDGLLIRDLSSSLHHIAVLKDIIQTYKEDARLLFEQFMSICEKPLFESKSNEKLTAAGMAAIEQFYLALSDLWRVIPVTMKTRLAQTLHEILTREEDMGGVQANEVESSKKTLQTSTSRQPAAVSLSPVTGTTTRGFSRRARNEPVEEVVEPDKQRSPVVDVDYVMARLAKSGALRNIVEEYREAAEKLDYLLPPPDALLPGAIATKAKKDDESVASMPTVVSPFKSKEEELAFYGVPIPAKLRTDNSEEDDLSPGPVVHNSRSHMDLTNTSSPADQAADAKALYRDYTQQLIDLCLDIVNHSNSDCAAIMFREGFANAVLILLQKDFSYDNRDKRLSFGVELLWFSLEAFIDQLKAEQEQAQGNKKIRSQESNVSTLLEPFDDTMDLALAIKTLKTLLLFQLNDGFRQSDKELRNEITIVLTLLTNFPNAVGHFISTQLLTIFVTYACVEEIGKSKWLFFHKPVADSRNFATLNDIDLEFKKQCWCIVTQLLSGNDVDALLCFAASPLMLCLFQYLEHEPSTPNNVSLSATSASQTSQFQGIASIATHPLLANSALISNSLSHVNSVNLSYTSRAEDPLPTDEEPRKVNPPGMSASQILLQMTQGNNRRGFIAQLSPSKLREFQLQAILCLLQNAPKVIGEFERMEGPLRLMQLTLKLIQQYQVNSSAHGGSTQGQHDYQMIVYYSLILLNRCLLNSTLIRSYMENNQVISVFLYVFIYSNHEESRAQAVRIIASLCSNHHTFCQNQVRQCNGIVALLQPLKQYVVKRPALVGLKAGLKINKNIMGSDPIPDPFENPFSGEVSVLVLSILDALKHIVVGNTTNELHFAEMEGLDILLDLLEISTFVLRVAVLRLLADLVNSNPQMSTLINCWRSSKTLRSAAQILCHAWLDEEARLNSERRERGIICDLFNPLGNHQWPLADHELPIVGFANADGDNPHYYVGKNSAPMSQSMTVNKLTSAILASRNAIQTNLPVEICSKTLESDTRVLLSDLFRNIGMLDVYQIAKERNVFKVYHESDNHVSNNTNTRRKQSVMCSGVRLSNLGSAGSSRNQLDVVERSDEECEEDNNSEDEESNAPTVTGTGFDDVRLSPREKQVLVLAKKYIALREGEWWRSVQHFVQEEKRVVPIEADLKLMKDRLEYSFDAAMATQIEQMELFDEEEQLKKDDENMFIDQVLVKKNQQIKAEWLKRNARGAPKKKIRK